MPPVILSTPCPLKGCRVLGAINLCFNIMRIMRQRFLWPDALPDANPPPLSRLGTGWGVPEGKSSGGVGGLCHGEQKANSHKSGKNGLKMFVVVVVVSIEKSFAIKSHFINVHKYIVTLLL